LSVDRRAAGDVTAPVPVPVNGGQAQLRRFPTHSIRLLMVLFSYKKFYDTIFEKKISRALSIK